MPVRCRALPCAVVVCALASAFPAAAQTEETEPLIIGRTGTTYLGVAGFLDKSWSAEDTFPGHFTIQVDAGRFVTSRWFIHGGLVGSGQFGEETDDRSGPAASALHASIGALYFFTPGSIVSPYAGAEYWGQLTQRDAFDRGSVMAKGGFQAAVTSRASVFVEGGYGRSLAKDDEGVFVSRWLGLVGIRLRM